MEALEKTINGNLFKILYFKDESSLSEINSLNDYNVIQVHYNPTKLVSELEAFSLIQECKNELLKEIKMIVENNQDFYKHFNYEYYFSSKSTELGIVNYKYYVIDIILRIKTSLKERG